MTGTDEHGMKVQQAAAASDITPKELCDKNAAAFRDLALAANVSHDRFIRTTDPDHMRAVEHFWLMLRERGLIYESKREGWYCVSDECFYPESLIERKMDAFTGEVYTASTETGNKVEWTVEKNYHFRMTALKGRLLEFYEKNPTWVVPATRMSEVVDWVNNNLEDLSISRPVDRLTWGIRVPDDDSQTIYVWVDALINYITAAGFPTWTPGNEQAGGWPADVHVIGKDILRFHCVYWPALLLALDLPLPKKILSHSHWTMERRKMSKSLGNVVNPFFALDRWGVDVMRFYLMHDGGISEDADYNNIMIVKRYKKCLQGVGNLKLRISKGDLWSMAEAIALVRDHGIKPIPSPQMTGVLAFQQEVLKKLTPAVVQHMEQLSPSAALRLLMEAMLETNRFLTLTAPWSVVKDLKTPGNMDLVNQSVYLVAESLRIIAILLQPVMPSKAAELLTDMGVSENRRQLRDAELFADFDYGAPMDAPKQKMKSLLFPMLPVED